MQWCFAALSPMVLRSRAVMQVEMRCCRRTKSSCRRPKQLAACKVLAKAAVMRAFRAAQQPRSLQGQPPTQRDGAGPVPELGRHLAGGGRGRRADEPHLGRDTGDGHQASLQTLDDRRYRVHALEAQLILFCRGGRGRRESRRDRDRISGPTPRKRRNPRTRSCATTQAAGRVVPSAGAAAPAQIRRGMRAALRQEPRSAPRRMNPCGRRGAARRGRGPARRGTGSPGGCRRQHAKAVSMLEGASRKNEGARHGFEELPKADRI